MIIKENIQKLKNIESEILKKLPKWQQTLRSIILEADENKKKRFICFFLFFLLLTTLMP